MLPGVTLNLHWIDPEFWTLRSTHTSSLYYYSLRKVDTINIKIFKTLDVDNVITYIYQLSSTCVASCDANIQLFKPGCITSNFQSFVLSSIDN